MGPRTNGCVAVVAAIVVSIHPSVEGQVPSRASLETILQQVIAFPEGSIEELVRGRAVARTVETSTAVESAAAGAVLINAPVERFLVEFTEIETDRPGPGVHAIGAFGATPSPADLSTFALTPDELAALRRCRPGDCAVKLPSAMLDRLQREVVWGSSAAPAVATRIMRGWLFQRLTAYLRDGDAALGLMHDKRPPTDLAEEFAFVLAHDELLARMAPDVAARLSSFPGHRTPDVQHAFYWARVDFGMKPTIRLNHVSIHPTPGAPHGLSHIVATKQIYASHYLRAALELRLIFPRPEGGFLLVTVTRTRSDGMTGLLGFVVRAKVRGRSRDGMIRYLQNVKTTLESGRRGEVVGAPD